MTGRLRELRLAIRALRQANTHINQANALELKWHHPRDKHKAVAKGFITEAISLCDRISDDILKEG